MDTKAGVAYQQPPRLQCCFLEAISEHAPVQFLLDKEVRPRNSSGMIGIGIGMLGIINTQTFRTTT